MGHRVPIRSPVPLNKQSLNPNPKKHLAAQVAAQIAPPAVKQVAPPAVKQVAAPVAVPVAAHGDEIYHYQRKERVPIRSDKNRYRKGDHNGVLDYLYDYLQ